ncbi:hypothetical protein BG004_004863 [Podila humilis]|nr:hypothetical protein BG004_004863 [Podila humilis]
MAPTKKQPVSAAVANPNASTKASTSRTQPQPPQQGMTSASLLKRKPVKQTTASIASSSSIDQNSHYTSTTTTASTPLRLSMTTDAMGAGMGMASSTPKASKTFQESQDELFSKLEDLAATKSRVNPVADSKGVGLHNNNSLSGLQQQQKMKYSTGYSVATPTHPVPNNKSTPFGQSQTRQASGYSSTASLKPFFRQSSTTLQQQGKGYGSNNSLNRGIGANYSAPISEKPREPRRRINSAQFKTPSTVEMAELAQIVVSNASPPKVQNKLRKRASTLSLTTTTFAPQSSQNPLIVAMTPNGGHELMDFDFRQRYEAALNDAKTWEKKYSSAQQQIHYERQQWEEKYGELERTLHNQESIKSETNVEKMNSLLDTVEQLQMANEVFRKQLMDANIEPDPNPAVAYHSHHLMVGENHDRTVLEENELIKEKSLITNQKIAHLSSEINNAAIAISQTINYVQLRYLTQMLDAAEHVSSQSRTRAMSNSFLSDMLSRGVKKAEPLQAKNTTSISTQTPPSVLTALQLQQQIAAVGGNCPYERKLSKSFSFTSSLLNLAGLNHPHHHHHHYQNGNMEIQYRSKGGALDDRSQLIHCRSGIPPVIVQDLKGSPKSPESIDLLATSRRDNAQLPKFQYASPTTSQLRLFVPEGIGHHTPSSVSNRSRDGSMHQGEDGSLRRSQSDISLHVSHQERVGGGIGVGVGGEGGHQHSREGVESGFVRSGGKYPYPYHHASRASSQNSMTSNILQRSTSQQFLSPEMALHFSHNSLTKFSS